MKPVWFAALSVLTIAIIDTSAAPGDARERISCTRHGCLAGKDSKRPIAGRTCYSRYYHARTYFFCASSEGA